MPEGNRYHRVLTMFRMGKEYSEICDAVGVSYETARTYVKRGRQFGELPPAPVKTRSAPTLTLTRALLDELQPKALARGITSKALARQILECVCKDQLIDAVLDDGGEERAKRC